MEQVKGQLTLFDLKKVVSSKQTWGMFTQEELQQHYTVLLDPSTSKHKLLHVLRKLDCYRLQLADLSSTHIGQAAATLAVNHPREEVRRLASALVDKWRVSFDAELFAELPYDAAAAAEAPDGDAAEFQVVAPPPPPPPPAAQPTRVQPARKERAQRIKEEEAYLDGSDAEGISESESEEEAGSGDEWQPPGGARRKSAGGRGSPHKPPPLSPGQDPKQKKLCWGPQGLQSAPRQ